MNLNFRYIGGNVVIHDSFAVRVFTDKEMNGEDEKVQVGEMGKRRRSEISREPFDHPPRLTPEDRLRAFLRLICWPFIFCFYILIVAPYEFLTGRCFWGGGQGIDPKEIAEDLAEFDRKKLEVEQEKGD